MQLPTTKIIPTTGLINPITDVSISFSRPKPEATFFQGTNQIAETYVAIYIRGTTDDPLTASHVVIVSRTGEIDVQ